MEYGITVITRDFGPLNPSPTLGAPTKTNLICLKVRNLKPQRGFGIRCLIRNLGGRM